jgi:hypothetical protein
MGGVLFLECLFNSIAQRGGTPYTYRSRNPFRHILDIYRCHNIRSSTLLKVLCNNDNIRLRYILFFLFPRWFYCIVPSNSILLYIRNCIMLQATGNFGGYDPCVGFQWGRFVLIRT